jgi:hypothetical protein
MDERKMLENAAKAAGYIPEEFIDNDNYMNGFLENWTPLNDKHDAFQLAEDMGFVVDFYNGCVIDATRLLDGHGDWSYVEVFEDISDVIVRLAASIWEKQHA